MMEFLAPACSWLLTLCLLLASAIYPLRRYCRSRSCAPSSLPYRAHRALQKCHCQLGGLSVILTLLHCRLSTQEPGPNLGPVCLLLLLLLWLTYALRKRLKARWIKLHRLLTAMLWAAVLLHVVLDT